MRFEVLQKAINQMSWKPESEWFDTRVHKNRLMFCNEAGQSVDVVGETDWSINAYLEHVQKLGMFEAAEISDSQAKLLMEGYTRAAIVAQDCASHLGTLAERNSDSLDFVEISKWDLKEMLENAYTRGWEDGLEDAEKESKIS